MLELRSSYRDVGECHHLTSPVFRVLIVSSFHFGMFPEIFIGGINNFFNYQEENRDKSQKSNMVLQTHQCSQCEYKAKQKSNLQRHIKSIHEGKSVFCQLCSKQLQFSTKGSLLTHINSVHKGHKLSCPQCEYKATQKGNLQTHIKSVHDGEKFPCPQCEYKATYKVSLQIHVKSVHEGQKFPCTNCGSAFTDKGNLQRHIKSVHEGQKFQNINQISA